MEEEHDHSITLPTPPPSSGEAGPSNLSSTELHAQHQQHLHNTTDQTHRSRRRQDSPENSSYRFDLSEIDVAPSDTRDNLVWPCLAVLVTLWLFATSITVILELYGSWTLQLGPNCSRLITANPFFVQSMQAHQIEGISGPMLYGFRISPVLEVDTTWTETPINATIQPNFHEEWMYYLNTGSKLDISYNVKSPSSSPLTLVTSQDEQSLIKWIEDPTYPNTTLSWNIIHGSGRIEQEITASANYYIAVANLNSDANLEVELNFTIKALLYNISHAYFKCSPYNRVCSFSLMFLRSYTLVLTSPGPQQVNDDDGWYIKLSYRPRWFTYILVSGVLAVTVLTVYKFYTLIQPSHEDGNRAEPVDEDQEEPFLSPKDDDLSSLGSSYDSVSNDEDEELEEKLLEEEKKVNALKFCVICFDSPRDCFFLPCGHCAACFTCGTRIAEEAGNCPVCRRRMKKARKIFSV